MCVCVCVCLNGVEDESTTLPKRPLPLFFFTPPSSPSSLLLEAKAKKEGKEVRLRKKCISEGEMGYDYIDPTDENQLLKNTGTFSHILVVPLPFPFSLSLLMTHTALLLATLSSSPFPSHSSLLSLVGRYYDFLPPSPSPLLLIIFFSFFFSIIFGTPSSLFHLALFLSAISHPFSFLYLLTYISSSSSSLPPSSVPPFLPIPRSIARPLFLPIRTDQTLLPPSLPHS